MTGSSAAALTGLMFVVISLVMGRERLRRAPDGIATFSTPTVMHFGAALLISGILVAPWHSLAVPAALIGIATLYAIVHVTRVAFIAKRLSTYVPDREDWICYTILPLVAYAASFGGALALPLAPVEALFAIATGTLLLVFIGIRNAWDIVTFIATGRADEDSPDT